MTLELLHGNPDSPLKFWKRDYWTYVSRKFLTYSQGNKKPDGVIVFGFTTIDNELDKLLVTREFRKPLNEYVWALPAGLIDEGENHLQAAVREMKEETGYDIDAFFEAGTTTGFASPGLTDECCVNVFCRIIGKPSRDGLEAHEDISTQLMSMEDLQKLQYKGEPMDVRLATFISYLNMSYMLDDWTMKCLED